MDAPILAIRSRTVIKELEQPTYTPVVSIKRRAYVAVEIFSADGQFGLGYVRAFDAPTVRAVHAIVTLLGEDLIGLPVSSTALAWTKMWQRINLLGRSGLQVYALSTLDTALWDLKAKLCGLPLYRLLGAARDSVPSYYSGAFLSASDEAIVEEAKELKKHGYSAFKIRIGLPDLRRDIERTEMVKRAFEGDLMMDAAAAFDRGSAVRAGKELAAFRPIWLEDALPSHKISDLEALRSACPIPLAGGEFLYGGEQIADFASRNVYDHVIFDLERIGGVTGWVKSSEIAERHGLRVSAHCFPEISVHILCGLENSFFHEQLDWSHELFVATPKISGGHAWPSEEPGLGLRFNEGWIKENLVEEAVIGSRNAIPGR